MRPSRTALKPVEVLICSSGTFKGWFPRGFCLALIVGGGPFGFPFSNIKISWPNDSLCYDSCSLLGAFHSTEEPLIGKPVASLLLCLSLTKPRRLVQFCIVFILVLRLFRRTNRPPASAGKVSCPAELHMASAGAWGKLQGTRCLREREN